MRDYDSIDYMDYTDTKRIRQWKKKLVGNSREDIEAWLRIQASDPSFFEDAMELVHDFETELGRYVSIEEVLDALIWHRIKRIPDPRERDIIIEEFKRTLRI